MNNKTVSDLKKNGFTKCECNVLSNDEVVELKNIINMMFMEHENIDTVTANCPVIVDLVGKNDHVDGLLEKIITHPSVKSVLDNVLGAHYKIWQVVARRSEAGDKGLGLHQDSPGETNLALLLSDNLNGDGATAFLSGSHKLPRWAKWISWTNPRFATPWVKALKGQTGDIGFFFNRTWHTRLLNNSKHSHDVILISFFPKGARYKPMNGIFPVLNKLKGLELGKLLNPEFGTDSIGNGFIRVSSAEKNTSFSMFLEAGAIKNLSAKTMYLYMKVLLLEIFYWPLRMLYRFAKSIKCVLFK